MDLRRGFLVGRIDEAEDLARLLVDPIVLVVDPVLALDLHIGLVRPDDVGSLHARDVVLVHVQRHRCSSLGLNVQASLASGIERGVASVDRPMSPRGQAQTAYWYVS